MSAKSRRAEVLFLAACELKDPVKRREYIAEACKGDPAMQARIERLVAAQSEAERFFSDCGSALKIDNDLFE